MAFRIGPHAPPIALPENFTERLRDRVVIFLATDFFFGRAVEPEQMIVRDTALLCVKPGQFYRIGNGAIEDNNRRSPKTGLLLRHSPKTGSPLHRGPAVRRIPG